MFSQCFKFFLVCIRRVFEIFKIIKLDSNFTYLDFIICLALCGLILIIFKLIKEDYVADRKFLDHMDRVERYKDNKKKMHSESIVNNTERKIKGSD